MDDYTIPITKPASQFAGNSSQQKQETTYPSEIVDLPSQGHFYPSSSPLSNGTINLIANGDFDFILSIFIVVYVFYCCD